MVKKKLMNGLNMRYKAPIKIFCDNKYSILISVNHVLPELKKHIEISCLW